jgi:hypothetical protein
MTLTRPLKPRPRPRPIRCTRPDWSNRIAWAAILISGAYLTARILPALLAEVIR